MQGAVANAASSQRGRGKVLEGAWDVAIASLTAAAGNVQALPFVRAVVEQSVTKQILCDELADRSEKDGCRRTFRESKADLGRWNVVFQTWSTISPEEDVISVVGLVTVGHLLLLKFEWKFGLDEKNKGALECIYQLTVHTAALRKAISTLPFEMQAFPNCRWLFLLSIASVCIQPFPELPDYFVSSLESQPCSFFNLVDFVVPVHNDFVMCRTSRMTYRSPVHQLNLSGRKCSNSDCCTDENKGDKSGNLEHREQKQLRPTKKSISRSRETVQGFSIDELLND